MDAANLKDRAKRILEYLDPEGVKSRALPRPVIIEFTGSPDAGKTTIIDALDPFFRRLGFRVMRPQEGAEVIRHVPRSDYEYNIRTGVYQLGLVMDGSYDRFTDLFILDRGLYDLSCWMEYWARKGQIDRDKANFYRKFFGDPKWLSKIDICFFVVCEPEEAIKRNQLAIPLDEFGETTNPESVKALVDITRKTYAYWHARGAPVVMVDTTNVAPKEVAAEIIDKTLEMLEIRFDLK